MTRFSFRLAVAPLLFLPPALHRLAQGMAGTEAGQPELRDAAVLSARHIPRNAMYALEWLFDTHNAHFPVSRPIAALAVVGAVLLARRLRDAHFRRTHGATIAWICASLSLFAVVQLSFAMGDLRTAYNMRLATIYLGPLALLAAIPAMRALDAVAAPRRKNATMLAAAVTLFAVYLPQARKNEVIGALTLPREYAHDLSILSSIAGADSVIVSDRPGMYVAQGMSALSPQSVPRQWQWLAPGNSPRRYPDLLIIQQLDRKSGAHTPPLPVTVPLSVVAQYNLDGDIDVVISRVNPSAPRRQPLSAR